MAIWISPVSRTRRAIRSALPLLACLAGSIPCLSGTASAQADSRPWRSLSAPVRLSLSNYIVQPPGDTQPPGDEVDPATGDSAYKELEPPPNPPGYRPPVPPALPPGSGPGFSIPDTSTARGDSMAWFQEDKVIGLDSLPEGAVAKEETAGAPAPGVKHRRGVLGIHPLALLAGLVAFHVFIVTVAGK